MYNDTGASVLITMVFHAGVNAGQGLYPVEGTFTPTDEIARFIESTVRRELGSEFEDVPLVPIESVREDT